MINLVLNNGEFHCINPDSITKVSGTATELKIHTMDGTVIKLNTENPEAARSFVEQASEIFPELGDTITLAMEKSSPLNGPDTEASREASQGKPQDAFKIPAGNNIF